MGVDVGGTYGMQNAKEVIAMAVPKPPEAQTIEEELRILELTYIVACGLWGLSDSTLTAAKIPRHRILLTSLLGALQDVPKEQQRLQRLVARFQTVVARGEQWLALGTGISKNTPDDCSTV